MSVSSLRSGFSDIVAVGGGIAGATIALVLARAGLTVTVLEQQPSYRDRVRGEYMQPWGVAEAQHLGIGEILIQAGAFFVRRIVPYDEINSLQAAEATARSLADIVPGVPGGLRLSSRGMSRPQSGRGDRRGNRYQGNWTPNCNLRVPACSHLRRRWR